MRFADEGAQRRRLFPLLAGILIAVLLVSNAVTLKFYFDATRADAEAVQDEIERAEDFVSDWFSELYAEDRPFAVYFNELRFDGGTYTLTAANRLRAVYPRGERYFNLKYITYVEFFRENESLYCRFSYGKDQSYRFALQE